MTLGRIRGFRHECDADSKTVTRVKGEGRRTVSSCFSARTRPRAPLSPSRPQPSMTVCGAVTKTSIAASKNVALQQHSRRRARVLSSSVGSAQLAYSPLAPVRPDNLGQQLPRRPAKTQPEPCHLPPTNLVDCQLTRILEPPEEGDIPLADRCLRSFASPDDRAGRARSAGLADSRLVDR